jgi:hypothetical protein
MAAFGADSVLSAGRSPADSDLPPSTGDIAADSTPSTFPLSNLDRILPLLTVQVAELKKETDNRFSALSSKWESDQTDHDTLITNLGRGLRDVVAELKSRIVWIVNFLLRYVCWAYLSCDGVSVLLDYLSPFEPLIWESICRRLLGRLLKHRSSVECLMTESDPLDGMISYLRTTHGDNCHREGIDSSILTIISKSVYDEPWHSLENVADLTSDSDFTSEDAPGQWVCWDCGAMRVYLTGYTISTFFLKSWVLECSVDGENWTEIDRQTDHPSFNDYDWEFDKRRTVTDTFLVSGGADCCFIRLTQTDGQYLATGCLFLIAVEFFGKLSE